MAFTTTQTLDTVLLRGLNFRTPANAPISTTYSLYANGQGQTYWSNSVNPANLSTLSTGIEALRSSVNSTFLTAFSTLNFQSTYIGSTQQWIFSSISSLTRNDAALSNSINLLSNQLNVTSNILNNKINTTSNYLIDYVNTTVLGISSMSTFYKEINAVLSTTVFGLSSLSTSFSQALISSSAGLTSNANAALQTSLVSSTANLITQISSLSTILATNMDLSTFSSIVTQQLTSTSSGLFSYASTIQTNAYNGLSTIASTLQSTMTVKNSTLDGLVLTVADLNQLSTNLSSISNNWISTFVSTSQGLQDNRTFQTISTISSNVGYLTLSTQTLYNNFSTFSTIAYNAAVAQLSTNTSFNSTLRGLQYEFSVITTSSILANIYDSFMQLEAYTSTLIGSTILSNYAFQSSLYISTTIENRSIAQSYFNFYNSTMYASTLSTLIPSTISFTSSMISSLYSTGNVFLTSSLNSTVLNLTDGFYSTTSSITQAIILSTATQFQSSVLIYLSSPAGAQLSTFSSLAFRSLSTFNGSGTSALNTQSTIFGSTINSQSLFYISTVVLFASLSTQTSTQAVQFAVNMSSMSTTFGRQLSTQNGFFNSTVVSYPTILNNTLASTNSAIFAQTSVAATSTLTTIQNSTITTYNQFVASLNAQASTVAVSSLYTVQTINLTSGNFVGNMDLATYRNFNVNVYNVLNGGSNYALTYLSNSLTGLDFRRGVITIDISTIGASYSNNNSLLRFDTYRWGIPTTVWGNMYPYISNADYTLQYEYTILNSVLYTNLLNVFPRLAVRNPVVTSTIGTSPVYKGSLVGGVSPIDFWRGSPIQISWSNYSYFPYGTAGTPPYAPEVMLDVNVNGSSMGMYGPYPLSQSTATIRAPYLMNQSVPVVPTKVRAYINGKPMEAAEVTFNTILPTFDTIEMYPRGYPSASQFLVGQEVVAVTDRKLWPVFNANAQAFGTTLSTTYNANPIYKVENLLSSYVNKAGYVGSIPSTTTTSLVAFPPPNQFSERSATFGYAYFAVSMPNYAELINILSSRGSLFTFTFRNAASTRTYTFTANTISFLGGAGATWVFANTTIPKATNTFTVAGETCFVSYTISFPPSSIESIAANFVGPIGGNTPDPAAFAQITNLNLTTLADPVSSLVFYNIRDSIKNANQAQENTLRGIVSYGANTYSSTFNLRSTIGLQAFYL
jgi:hypothetical protein